MILRDYQAELVERAVAVLLQHRLVYLALETRTGKTPVSIMAAARISKDIIFATKKSVIPSIEGTIKGLREDYPELALVTIAVVSFDSLHKVDFVPGRVIIADEAHSFGKYPTPSKRAKMLWGLARQCYVIFLSATPTPESFSQIYHQLWAAHSNSPLIEGYKNFFAWAKDYVTVKQKRRGAGILFNDYSCAKADLIIPHTAQMMITYTQKEAGFKQDKVQEIFYPCHQPKELTALISTLLKDRVVSVGGHQITADTPVTLMAKTHQLCSGTVIADDSKEGLILSKFKIERIKFIMHLFPRIAIYYKYIAEGKMLFAEFGDRATDDYRIFAADPSKIYIGQVISKREGIDLKEADAIIMFNIDFAYLSYEQTKNRMQTIDRPKPAVLIWLFSEGGIEEKIYKVVCKKKNFTTAYFRRRYKND